MLLRNRVKMLCIFLSGVLLLGLSACGSVGSSGNLESYEVRLPDGRYTYCVRDKGLSAGGAVSCNWRGTFSKD